MDSTRISKALAEAVQSDPSKSLSSLPEDLVRALPRDLVREIEGGELLTPLLSQEPPFNEGGSLLSDGAGGGLGFHGPDATRYLVRRVQQQGQTCDEAVADLQAVLSADNAECLTVLALWGTKVDAPIDLGENVTLVPFASIPDSATKSWIKGASDHHVGHGYVPTLFRTSPTCALCYGFTASPVWIRGNAAMPDPKRPVPSEQLREVALALALVGPCSPVSGPSWTQYLDPRIEEAKSGVMMSTTLMDVVPHTFGETVRLQPELVREVVGDYLSTSGGVRVRLQRSLTRFNRAMRWHDSGDKALDLAIALEALLTDDAGENTFKTALRAGLLMEGSTSERTRARAIVSAVYSVRSAVVHDGVTPIHVKVSGSGKEPTEAVVKEATTMAAGVLRRIARDGQIPDWRQFDLGAPT